jgi:hypothetical protein
MTDIYPLPPPFSDDEILKPLRPQSAAPAKRWNAVAAGVAASTAQAVQCGRLNVHPDVGVLPGKFSSLTPSSIVLSIGDNGNSSESCEILCL